MARMITALCVALALLGASESTAQDKATELTAGVIGLAYTTCSGCDGVFATSTGGAENGAFNGLGGGTVAVGLYLSSGMSIEPNFAISTLSGGGETLTVYTFGLALPYYFAKGWGRKGPYVAPRVAYNGISGGGASFNQVALGGSLGTKVPLNEMAALRLQANFDYGFEGDFLSTTAIGAFVGLSVFLK